jgi:transposase
MTAPNRRNERRRVRRPDVLHKPGGVIHPRVQRVGPEHFGIVAVDCAKARSKWMLADFYGNVLVPPTVAEHTRAALEAAVSAAREGAARHDIRDLLVAVERTGRYHHPPKRAFAAGGFEVRTVHPFATKQFRLPADPGNKTDDTDLAAICRAATNGFALIEAEPGESWRELQLLTRYRRNLVFKQSALCNQIREHLEAAMPGYAACFPSMWDNPAALRLAWELGSAGAIRDAGKARMAAVLRERKIGFQQRTLERVLQWAQGAAAADVAAERHRWIAAELDAERGQKGLKISDVERQIASLLVRTPYVLLMSIPGVNVVSAAEYGAEMGPIGNYANARCITGRAGVYPSRHQSDRVDVDGPLVRCANRRLRFALLQIADNLVTCNHYFAMLAARWTERQNADPRLIRVRVAQRFSRISFQMVAGGRVFAHPCVRGRDYVLDKLIRFHYEHATAALQVQQDLQCAIKQLPPGEHAAEARPLQEELNRIQEHRRRGPQPLGEILPAVLAALGVNVIQSPQSGSSDPA